MKVEIEDGESADEAVNALLDVGVEYVEVKTG